jgi:predicted kinase
MLVVIVGPIASGKSTLAAALGAELRRSGRLVAVLDLDDVVATIGGFADLAPERFADAQVVFGRMVGAWLLRGADVIAHGPFLSSEEDDALLHALPDGVRPRRVLLTTTLAVALERVGADPDRLLASYPEVLEATYDRFDELLPSMAPSEWTFDTAEVDVGQIVTQLGEALLE